MDMWFEVYFVIWLQQSLLELRSSMSSACLALRISIGVDMKSKLYLLASISRSQMLDDGPFRFFIVCNAFSVLSIFSCALKMLLQRCKTSVFFPGLKIEKKRSFICTKKSRNLADFTFSSHQLTVQDTKNRGRHPGPGLILKSGTGNGTQIQNLRDLGLGLGLKFEKSGTRDRDSKLKNPGSGTGTGTQISGTRTPSILTLNFFNTKNSTQFF